MRRIALAVLVSSGVLFAGALVLLRLPPKETALLAPVALAFVGAGLTLLSLRAREAAEGFGHERPAESPAD